jgi:AcrR family transcriptional regulator
MKSSALHKFPLEATRERILQAASELFAVQGFKSTTLREITEAAQANLAAVNYHFRSKEDLIASAIEAAVEPVIAARMASLQSCLARNAQPSVRDLAEALVVPLHELSRGEYRNCVLLLMQLRPDPGTTHNALVAQHFASLHETFVSALARVLPHLPRAELAVRYDCARGSVLQALVELAPARDLVHMSPKQRAHTRKSEAVVAALIGFVSAGFSAPATMVEK